MFANPKGCSVRPTDWHVAIIGLRDDAEQCLNLQPSDETGADRYAIQGRLNFVKFQPARLPSRNEV